MPSSGHDADDRARLSPLPLQASARFGTSIWVRFITHEMNRCIACYRCVRFYREYAGGRDFDVFAAAQPRLFRHAMRTAFSKASSAAISLKSARPACFTTSRSRQFTSANGICVAPSVCVHCALGCNTTHDERYGTLRRNPQPLQRRGEWLLPLRSRPIWLRLRREQPRIRDLC